MLRQELVRKSQNVYKSLKILKTTRIVNHRDNLFIKFCKSIYQRNRVSQKQEPVAQANNNWKSDQIQDKYHNRAEIMSFESFKQEVEILPEDFVHTLTDKECQVNAAT